MTALEAMERFGGSFVQRLAALYRVADPDNRARIEAAFAEEFTRYAELARDASARV